MSPSKCFLKWSTLIAGCPFRFLVGTGRAWRRCSRRRDGHSSATPRQSLQLLLRLWRDVCQREPPVRLQRRELLFLPQASLPSSQGGKSPPPPFFFFHKYQKKLVPKRRSCPSGFKIAVSISLPPLLTLGQKTLKLTAYALP